MKKITKIVCAFVCGVFSALPAIASVPSTSHQYYLQLHFSKFAFGKEVSAVYAHVGALEQGTGSDSDRQLLWWEDVQHFPLKLQNNHFYGKTVVKGHSTYQLTAAQGAIVQYWVYYKDGSTLITREAPVVAEERMRLSEMDDYDSAYAKAEDKFASWTDALETSCIEVDVTSFHQSH